MARLFDPLSEARQLSTLVHTNPFRPERIEIERGILGDAFVDPGPTWFLDPDDDEVERPNLTRLRARCGQLVERARGRLAGEGPIEAEALEIYEDLWLYTLYERFEDQMFRALEGGPKARLAPAPFAAFAADYEAALRPAWARGLPETPASLAFAFLWQLRRAFHFIHRRILGVAPASARLRATVWESVFTYDMARYRRGLYLRMHEFPTLILGPSGTGKELVAAAIGASRFIPFDAERGVFEEDFQSQFQPVHLAALAESLVESELFGHEKGAFTGAQAARRGYLEGRSSAFTVFLDEIGEVPLSLQVKLLRVLQTREFARVGGAEPRRFEGKVVAATHRDLPACIQAGTFREDLFYRLCADVVETPRLVEIVGGDPERLTVLVRALLGRIWDGPDREPLIEGVVTYVDRVFGWDYAWPGNIRELEQVIRNLMVRGPGVVLQRAPEPASGIDAVLAEVRAGTLSAEDLLSRYATLVYAQEGTFEGTARRLQIDRRTVKRHVDDALLATLRARKGS